MRNLARLIKENLFWGFRNRLFKNVRYIIHSHAKEEKIKAKFEKIQCIKDEIEDKKNARFIGIFNKNIFSMKSDAL